MNKNNNRCYNLWLQSELTVVQSRETTLPFDRGQTREIGEKQEKYFKGKVVTLTVQSLILYQYPVDLLTFFELY